MSSNNRISATVKWFNHAKGFGFIDGPDGDVFVHYRSIDPDIDGYKSLSEGEQVEFSQVKSERGWQAAEVTRLERTATVL